MSITIKILTALVITLASLPTIANTQNRQSTVISSQNLSWGYLNPLRGDKSPGATDLWGDRTKNVATGMLVKFNKGFTSPPHIHNITYRGIVIEGLMHNDDPTAEHMWLPSTSYWTQPAGENHVTAANSESNLIYLEIDSGPYLVKPSDHKFDNGERPINVHASNLVWLNQSESSTIIGDEAEVAYLWQNGASEKLENRSQGYLIKVSQGAVGKIISDSKEFRAVIIQGKVDYSSTETPESITLPASSYYSSNGTFTHNIAAHEESIIYIRSNDKVKVYFSSGSN
jgi:hypothetical protein